MTDDRRVSSGRVTTPRAPSESESAEDAAPPPAPAAPTAAENAGERVVEHVEAQAREAGTGTLADWDVTETAVGGQVVVEFDLSGGLAAPTSAVNRSVVVVGSTGDVDEFTLRPPPVAANRHHPDAVAATARRALDGLDALDTEGLDAASRSAVEVSVREEGAPGADVPDPRWGAGAAPYAMVGFDGSASAEAGPTEPVLLVHVSNAGQAEAGRVEPGTLLAVLDALLATWRSEFDVAANGAQDQETKP